MQKPYFSTLLFLLLCSAQMSSQEMKFAGTHPPDPEVIKLLEREAEIFDTERDVKKRDSLRLEIVSSGFFYHGQDGLPVNLKDLVERQVSNAFEFLDGKVLSETLYQYESTAILVVVEWTKVRDRGKIYENYESYCIVMGVESGKWKILADIQGREPEIDN